MFDIEDDSNKPKSFSISRDLSVIFRSDLFVFLDEIRISNCSCFFQCLTSRCRFDIINSCVCLFQNRLFRLNYIFNVSSQSSSFVSLEHCSLLGFSADHSDTFSEKEGIQPSICTVILCKKQDGLGSLNICDCLFSCSGSVFASEDTSTLTINRSLFERMDRAIFSYDSPRLFIKDTTFCFVYAPVDVRGGFLNVRNSCFKDILNYSLSIEMYSRLTIWECSFEHFKAVLKADNSISVSIEKCSFERQKSDSSSKSIYVVRCFNFSLNRSQLSEVERGLELKMTKALLLNTSFTDISEVAINCSNSILNVSTCLFKNCKVSIIETNSSLLSLNQVFILNETEKSIGIFINQLCELSVSKLQFSQNMKTAFISFENVKPLIDFFKFF
jgi:hypothetical protein